MKGVIQRIMARGFERKSGKKTKNVFKYIIYYNLEIRNIFWEGDIEFFNFNITLL